MRIHPLILAVFMVTFVIGACSPSGTIIDDGEGALPDPVEDVLTITSPADSSTVDHQTVTVIGSAPDGADVVQEVSLGRDVHVTANGGRWSIDVALDEGDNLLTFRVADDESSSITLYLIYMPVATQTPEPVATETPSPTATPEPTPTKEPEPTDEQEPEPLVVKIAKRTASLRRNQTASVTIKTSQGASCSIDVVYPSGSSTAKGLDPKKANSSGVVTWKWKVGGNTTRGTHSIYIWCEKGDRTGSVDTTFRVR